MKDIVKDIFGGQTLVWWWFSGSTGLYTNNQTVCLSKQILFNTKYTVCSGKAVKLIGRTSSDNTYQWLPTDGLDNPSVQTPLANPTKPTNYTVTYKNYCGITVQDTIRVDVPLVDIKLGNDTTLCEGATLVLKPSVANATYKWQDGSTLPQYTVTKAGSYSIEVTSAGCVNTSSITIRYAPKPVVALGKDTTLCPGARLLLKPTVSGASYLWEDGTKEPAKEVTAMGTYWVRASLNGCSNSDTINVRYTNLPTNPLGADTSFCKG